MSYFIDAYKIQGGGGIDYTLTADSGAFVLTGQDVALTEGFILTAENGAFVLTGQDVTLTAPLSLNAETGEFVLTGQDVALTRDIVMTMESGSFALTGQDVTLDYFDPSNISNLELWLDASDLETLYQDSAKTTAVTSDADPIGCWEDKSGNGYDFIQATSGKQPTYKTGIFNGKPVIRADGTEWLENLTKANWIFLHDGNPSTTIIVYKVADNHDSVYGLIGNAGSSAPSQIGILMYHDDRSSIPRSDRVINSASNGGAIASFVSLSDDDDYPSGGVTIVEHGWEKNRTGDDSIHYRSGVETDSYYSEDITPSSSNATYDMQIFANGNDFIPMIGDIAEVIVYSKIITPTERTDLVNDLKNKWITSSADSTQTTADSTVCTADIT